MTLSELRKISQIMENYKDKDYPLHQHQIFQEMGLDPKSLYQELEMESAYADTHQDISYTNRCLHIHSHGFYEIICCRNNCNAEFLVGAERYKLQKGDIIFVPPGISHLPLLTESKSEPYVRDILWLSEKFVRLLINTNPEISSDKLSKPFLFRTADSGWEFVCDLIRNGVREYEESKLGWSTMVVANTAKVFIHLMRAGEERPVNPMKAEKPELLDQVLSFVEDHLSEKLSLAEIARIFYVSESTITQVFRKKMGISFYRCVTQRRLIAAKKLIETNITLEAIAEQVGFTDYSSFFRAFKQEYGISPRQYRKMQSN